MNISTLEVLVAKDCRGEKISLDAGVFAIEVD